MQWTQPEVSSAAAEKIVTMKSIFQERVIAVTSGTRQAPQIDKTSRVLGTMRVCLSVSFHASLLDVSVVIRELKDRFVELAVYFIYITISLPPFYLGMFCSLSESEFRKSFSISSKDDVFSWFLSTVVPSAELPIVVHDSFSFGYWPVCCIKAL